MDDTQGITSRFKKELITQKTGQLFFNIVQLNNTSAEAVRIKPMFLTPGGWTQFNPPLADTLIQPGDSIFLSLRARIPAETSSETDYTMFFRAFDPDDGVLSECEFTVVIEKFHDWGATIEKDRVFFTSEEKTSRMSVVLSNNGNVEEAIHLKFDVDKKIRMEEQAKWTNGLEVILPPFHDTVIEVTVTYINDEERVFDMGRVSLIATSEEKTQRLSVLIEKYNDVYAPLFIDRSLPHMVEVGFRTFSNNKEVLPFIKTRGKAKFKRGSTFTYNFNYYAITRNENFLTNSYYNFLYQWRDLKVGLGAFSSQLGRNLYTRNGIMVSNIVRLSPTFSLEAFISQSIFAPKTSAAIGYTLDTKKVDINGSFAYDRDAEKGLNTSSGILRVQNIKLFKTHQVNVSIYGFGEDHYRTNDYTLAGVAYDLSYFGKIGKSFTFQLINNYGSPNVPGAQMGLFLTNFNATYAIDERIRYFSMNYIYGTRTYYNMGVDGTRLPDNKLRDQYVNFKFHSNLNPNHTWEAGPSFEVYRSSRPSQIEGQFQEFWTQKLRIEYKSNIHRNLSLNAKAGLSDLTISDSDTLYERRYDFHLMGGYNFLQDYSVSFSYDYGPMVNSGLYQYAGDALNHSISVGPSMSSTYLNNRINFNLFANLQYRIDLNNIGVNINPRIETYIARDWYFVASGTYHFNRQEYRDKMVSNSFAYAEFSVRKMWGKSDFNRWQKDTRKVKLIFFKDDNSNGVKDYGEQGVPYVKARMRLTNSASPNVSTQFPVDVVLLSNDDGVVMFNRMPVGFYELTIIPLGDVKEYFYVDRGAEKLEITKVSVFYIPFQKASRLTGTINVKRAQFIKQGEEALSLENIRVTAYNKTGNSYSSFTLADGSFTIYVPGENEYYVRLPNVFGETFRILKNDILTYVSDTAGNFVAFNVVEKSRQISFKKAEPAEADTVEQPLKIKVLHGKMYENQPRDTVDVNATPDFNIKYAPPPEQKMETGRFYVTIGGAMEQDAALKYHRVLTENGHIAYIGLDEAKDKYYVFSNYFTTEREAKKERDRLEKAGLSEVKVLEY